MLKQAVIAVLLLPAFAFAECGFSSSGSEMIIVVSKKSNDRCFQSEAFRESFRASLLASVKSMDERAEASGQRRGPPPRRRIVPAAELPVQQAVLYYGQNPKR